MKTLFLLITSLGVGLTHAAPSEYIVTFEVRRRAEVFARLAALAYEIIPSVNSQDVCLVRGRRGLRTLRSVEGVVEVEKNQTVSAPARSCEPKLKDADDGEI